MRRVERHFAMLRAILSDYQYVISGPDVQRGIDAVESLEAEWRASRISYLQLWDWASRMPQDRPDLPAGAQNSRYVSHDEFPGRRPGDSFTGTERDS